MDLDNLESLAKAAQSKWVELDDASAFI